MKVWEQLILTLIPGVFIAILTSVLTVRFSLRRFYSERWWEHKREAYSKIIDALYDLKRFWKVDVRRTGIDTNAMEIFTSTFPYDARDELEKTVGVGAYVVSDEAIIILDELIEGLDKVSHNKDNYDTLVSLYSKALDSMRECVKTDLYVQSPWWQRWRHRRKQRQPPV